MRGESEKEGGKEQEALENRLRCSAQGKGHMADEAKAKQCTVSES